MNRFSSFAHRAARHCSLAAAALWALLLLGLLGPQASAATPAPPDRPETAVVRVGVLAVLDDGDTRRVWQPLLERLSQHLPQASLELLPLDPPAMEQAVLRGALDFVITNPGHYVVLEARHGVTRIATQTVFEGGDPAHAVGSAVVMRADRPAPPRLAGLAGWRVAAVAADAFGGYQLVAAEWARQGLDAEAGAVQMQFTGFPMSQALDRVISGQADAAILRTCLLERWEREGRVVPGSLQVVAALPDARLPCSSSTPLYPGWAFAALPQVSPELARHLALALFSLGADEQGTRWSVPADYQRVHEVLRTLEVEPYAFLRATRIEALARRYWFVIGAVALAMLLGLLYTLRVEALVKRRTAELTRSLDERDRLARARETDRQALDHLSRLSILGELSATLGHELNQPLASVANYAASMRRRLANRRLSEDALRQALDDIGAEAERAAHIVAGIRALSRKRQVQRRLCDPQHLAEEAVHLFCGLQSPAPQVRLSVDASAAGQPIQADALQIQQVLLNLLKNAWDAHRAGGAEHEPLRCRVALQDGQVLLTVEDRGPWLPEAQRAHLFEPFFTTKPDGLGLGLPICRTIVEAHGGALQARPVDPEGQGPGMVFEVRLPVHLHAEPCAVGTAAAAA